MLAFSDKLQTRDVRFFDIAGYHPNIKTIKAGIANSQQVWDYCTKFGEYSGAMTHPASRSAEKSAASKAAWAEAIAQSRKEDFFEILRREEPR